MTSDEFKIKFGLPFSDFSAAIGWKDAIGFSFTEDYQEGYVSIYKVGVNNQNSEESIKKLWASVSYGKKTSEGISLGTGGGGFRDPVDLDFFDEYTYDVEIDKFYCPNKEIKPKDIILNIEKIHKLPTRKIKGFFLRTRLRYWRKYLPNLIKFVDWVFNQILWLISGEEIEKNLWTRIFKERHLNSNQNDKVQQEVVFKESEKMDFFGYKAKRWSVVFYCITNLLIFVIFYIAAYKPNFLNLLFKNSFFVLCYVVVSFAFTESLLPEIIKYIIVKITKLFSDISFKRIRAI